MNLPNFKELLQKLAVFKNNMSLLVAVILAVIGGLLLIPTHFMNRSVQARVQQDSMSLARDIDRLNDSVVSKDQFQNAAAIEEAYAKDFNDVNQLAEQTTKRELLSYDIFPGVDPNTGFSALVFQVFGQRYRNGIDELITRVNARDCPTTEEIQRGLEDLSSGARSRSGFGMMGGYETMAGGGLYRGSMMMGSVQRMIVDEMCVDRAKSTSVYANAAEIAGYDYWGAYVYDVKPEEAVKECWYYQLAYWVIEDIFDTIETMNSSHDNVLTAPVKRFMSLTFTMGLNRPKAGGGVFTGFRRQRRQGQSREDADKPAYVLSASEGLTESCTGRFSEVEGGINVIHFNAAFVVGARDVLPFMEELCSGKEHQFRGYPDGTAPPQTFKHNQITILESKIRAPTLTDMTHRYYSYGQDNVVVLDLVCEYIFNEKGYEAIIPESVKNTLLGLDEEATQ